MDVTVGDILQGGGILAFAGVVFILLREQTSVLRGIGKSIIKIVERQNVIMDRQKVIHDSLVSAGYEVTPLPDLHPSLQSSEHRTKRK